MDPDGPTFEHIWKAGGVGPGILLKVVGVFAFFMVLAHFVFHSPEAVKALLVAAIGSTAATLPTVLTRIQYRLTETGLEKRPFKEKDPREFEAVFSWDQLVQLEQTPSGFRYHKRLEEPNRFLRFLKVHFLSDYAGEIHVEEEGLARVVSILDRYGPYGSLGSKKPGTLGGDP